MTTDTTSSLPAESDHEHTLPDRRTLGYARLGDPDGPPIIVLDGPGSRGLARACATPAEALGVALIAVDRPGFGRSSPVTHRSIATTCEDVVALADGLGLRRFGVLGQSGGTPYALGVAAAAGDRIVGVALTGAVTPLGEPDALEDTGGPMRQMFVLARRAPWLLRPAIGSAARQTKRDPDAAAKKYAEGLPELDRGVLEDPRMWAIHARTSAEAIASPKAFAREVKMLTRPWDIDLPAISAPVALWAGDRDGAHPVVMSRRLAERLGGAPVSVVAGAGTFGLSTIYGDALHHAAGLGALRTVG